jgi:FkbM family methyltransferase
MRIDLAGLIRLSAVGATFLDRVAIVLSGFASRLSIPMRIRVLLGGRIAQVTLHDGADRTVLREMALSSDYERTRVPSPPVIVDVGANVGFAALYFAGKYPDATIHAIEASPRNYARLVQNTREHPQIRTYLLGIGARDERAVFYSYPLHYASSFKPREDRGAAVPTTIRVATLATFLTEQKIDFVGLLKIDVEGHEAEVLEGADLSRVRQIVVELHHELMAKPRSWFDQRLTDFALEEIETQPRRTIMFAHRA